MNRSILDKALSSAGLIVSVVLFGAAIGLQYTHVFVHGQVRDQLAAQKITFPKAGSEELNALPAADKEEVNEFAGQQLLTGRQAKVFADNYIAVHLKKIGGGKTYSELSAASLADPTNAKLAGQVQTVFRGETLRGLLLNAYAFDTMAVVAGYAAIGALIAAFLTLGLSLLGFVHASRLAREAKGKTKRRK